MEGCIMSSLLVYIRKNVFYKKVASFCIFYCAHILTSQQTVTALVVGGKEVLPNLVRWAQLAFLSITLTDCTNFYG